MSRFLKLYLDSLSVKIGFEFKAFCEKKHYFTLFNQGPPANCYDCCMNHRLDLSGICFCFIFQPVFYQKEEDEEAKVEYRILENTTESQASR